MRKIEGKERDDLILRILKRIESDTQIVGAPDRAEVWERGWAEVMAKFRGNPIKESLIPAFIHQTQPVRWRQEFCTPTVDMNELDHVRYIQTLLADFLKDCDPIAEFGCGTGYNLVALAECFPIKYFCGYDFAQSAVDLVHQAAWAMQLNINSEQYDMKHPRGVLAEGTGVFTFGAIEQLAGEFKPFMEWLISQKPRIVIHVEPMIELLDENNLVDYLAIMFMKKRGYTSGLLPWLQNDPRIEVFHVERTGFGSLMIEGYNIVCWRLKCQE